MALAFSLWPGVMAFTAPALLEQFIVEALIALAPSEQNVVRCICIAWSCPKLPRAILYKEAESNVTTGSGHVRCCVGWRAERGSGQGAYGLNLKNTRSSPGV